MQRAGRLGSRKVFGTILAVAALLMSFSSETFVMLYVQTQAVTPFRPSDKVPIMLGGLASAAVALTCAATSLCVFATKHD